ncbi:hypothetical protein FHU41_000012 [Psychromicrobium silvestre]|uniref:DUF5302 domain-containing protein n=1 Tax=Psychromicrobium silvestre TaxID=1645614 RepID=A0A7Y9LQL7_9MICC|nr:hypothetical protein [Psychromicrobium silvestre]
MSEAEDSQEHASTSEETKRKFREALERKNAQHHATVEGAKSSKIGHEHASASTKREFRRKSG